MSRLEDDLARYFGALDGAEPSAMVPSYPVTALSRRGPSRRVVLVAAFVLLVAAIAGAFAVHRSSEGSAPYVEIPQGWQTVTFGDIQFGVPGDWPVYTDDRCPDASTSGVYAEGRWPAPSCPIAPRSALSVAVVATVDWAESGMHPFTATTPDTMVNGLRAQLNSLRDDASRQGIVDVVLLDDAVAFSMAFPDDDEHRALADQILQTIGPARDPQPRPTLQRRPPEPTTTTTRYAPEVAAYCEAIENYQNAGVGSAPEGAPVAPGALPYLKAVLDAAPGELRPPLETVVGWLEQGSPAPTPAEVTEAANRSNQDWVDTCTDIQR